MSTNHNNKNNKTSVNRMTTDIKTKPSVSKKNELRRKKLKQRKRRRIISIIVISLFVLVIIFSSSILLTMGKVKRTDLDNDNLGISDKFINDLNYSDSFGDIVNIAMFGVDQEVDNIQRSDAIMIGTLDTVNKKIKITSIMRDTYVNIPDYGYDKLNHAYAYGGPELAIKTINKNFDLNITDYVAVDFTELEDIIDAIGGIDMEMTSTELEHVNAYLDTVYIASNKTPKHVSFNHDGKVHMTGYEALGYTRIRGTAGGDFDRTERQRKITNEMFNNISSAGVGKLALMMNKLLPYVETSLSNTEILNLGTQVVSMGSSDLEQARFPRDEYSENALINSIFYLTYDEDIAREEIHEYLFKDIKLWNNSIEE
ncbi:LCP family protein [Clostridium sp.]|uniref:LCP family protein n=1 Tax=Clostridium sp. TaxID=1506 RepID=UPI00321708EC